MKNLNIHQSTGFEFHNCSCWCCYAADHHCHRYQHDYHTCRHISDANVDAVCICGIYCKSVRPRERDLSSALLLLVFSFSLKGF